MVEMKRHADAMLASLQSATAKAYRQKIYDGASLPKLGSYFLEAKYVDEGIEKIGGKCFWTKDRLNPHELYHGVPARLINMSLVAGYSDELQKQLEIEGVKTQDYNAILQIESNCDALCEQVLKDLHSMGLPAFHGVHKAKLDDIYINQYCLFLPNIKLEGEPTKPKEAKDFDGGVLMLAYLLHKGYVTEKDIPQTIPLTEYQRLVIPFDQTMLKLALSTPYQNKVREALGESIQSLTHQEKLAMERNTKLSPEHPGISHT